MVQVTNIALHLTVTVILQQHPVQLLIVFPFDELRKLVAHKAQFLSGMSDHETVKCTQIVEFFIIGSGHLIDEGALAVHDLIM